MTFLTRFPSYICVSRRLRYIPEGGSLVEITSRTVQSRFLLRPSAELNEIIVGVLGRARELYPVQVCGASFLSNHYHLLLWVENAKRMADFMGYFNSNLAREISRRTGWRDKVWARRYASILVSDEEAAQRERLRYLLSHGAKEGLVLRPEDWPGVHSVRALRDGEPLRGYWFDRTRELEARNQDKDYSRLEFATEYEIELACLPCWRHLPQEVARQRVAALVEEIEADALRHRQATGLEPLGVRAILRQRPEDRPLKTKKSSAPLVHAATKAVRSWFWEAYSAFVAAFRDAAELQRSGDRSAQFPTGSFPPALPFVGLVPARAP